MASDFSWSSLLDFTGVAGVIAALKAIRHSGEQAAKVGELERRVDEIAAAPSLGVEVARHDERIKAVERAVEAVGTQLVDIHRSVANLESGDERAAGDRAEILRKLDLLQESRS